VTTSDRGGGGDALSRLLHQLRADADLSGTEAGKRAGISRSKISRSEHGRYVPTANEIKKLARIYKASPEVRERMLAIVTDLAGGYTPSRVGLHRSAVRFQQRIGRIEQASAHVAMFAPTVVPSLLQTAGYARVLMEAGELLGVPVGDVDGVVRARLERQELLTEPDRQFVLMMTEAALHWQAKSPAVMLEQIERIEKALDLASVQIGVIPLGVRAFVFPTHGFDLYDRRAAIVGTETATALLTEPSDVGAYQRLFDHLQELAVFDGETRPVLERVKAHYYRLQEQDRL
jgi:transcriptional regulator with XRE-family HTH domain